MIPTLTVISVSEDWAFSLWDLTLTPDGECQNWIVGHPAGVGELLDVWKTHISGVWSEL